MSQQEDTSRGVVSAQQDSKHAADANPRHGQPLPIFVPGTIPLAGEGGAPLQVITWGFRGILCHHDCFAELRFDSTPLQGSISCVGQFCHLGSHTSFYCERLCPSSIISRCAIWCSIGFGKPDCRCMHQLRPWELLEEM